MEKNRTTFWEKIAIAIYIITLVPLLAGSIFLLNVITDTLIPEWCTTREPLPGLELILERDLEPYEYCTDPMSPLRDFVITLAAAAMTAAMAWLELRWYRWWAWRRHPERIVPD